MVKPAGDREEISRKDMSFSTASTFAPPSDVRVNMEAGLRSALSLCFAFLWIGNGPFGGTLSFFAGATSIMSLGNTAGETIMKALSLTKGAAVGALLSFFVRWMLLFSPVTGALGYFVSVFLIVRSRRVDPMGRRIGCVALTLLGIAQSRDLEFPTPWADTVGVYLRTLVEGGIFALAASLLPYPRLATRSGTRRAQFICRLLSEAVEVCMTDFIEGRDETSISTARHLSEQVQTHLGILRKEITLSRTELGLLFCGCCDGGMRSADTLEQLAQLMEQVLQGVRGIRQTMAGMQPMRTQIAFGEAMSASLSEVAASVHDVLIAMSDGNTLWHRSSLFLRIAPSQSAQDRVRAVERLKTAVGVLMVGFETAKMRIEFGLDKDGRPLEPETNDRAEDGSGAEVHRQGLSFVSSTRGVSSLPYGGAMWHGGLSPMGECEKDGQAAHKVPSHIIAKEERRRMGGQSSMARAAFMFMLQELCTTLVQVATAGPPAKTPTASYIFNRFWKAVRPPPELRSMILGAIRYVRYTFFCCKAQEAPDEGITASSTTTPVPFGATAASRPVSGKLHVPKRYAKCWGVGTTFWAFKVSLALTLCVLFQLVTYLDEMFRPSAWVAVTAAFVMANESGSAVSSCLLRLVGTVLGATYSIVMARVSETPEDQPFHWKTYAVVLPWVALTCFFRNSDSFSYAVVVSAVTATVMFTGGDSVLGAQGETLSLARIVNTVIGISIYLAVDIFLVPTRAKGLLRQQMYITLDAALQQVSVNGERLFGARVCPRSDTARPQRPGHLFARKARAVHLALSAFKTPTTPRDSSGQGATSHQGRTSSKNVSFTPSSSHHRRRTGESSDIRRRKASSVRDTGGKTSTVEEVGFSTSAEGAEWGRVTGDEEEQVAGSMTEAVEFSTEEQKEGTGVIGMRRGEAIGGSDIEEGRNKQNDKRDDGMGEITQGWKKQAYLQKMVRTLALQKKFLPLAELEPQLWYRPFHAITYRAMLDAEEELLRALTLMSKTALAICEDRSTNWRRELGDLGSHLAQLVKLLKAGLADARDVFAGLGQDAHSSPKVRLLEVQPDAIRIDANLNADFVSFIQDFVDRGAFPELELEFLNCIHAAIYSVMGTQKALLNLGHAVAAVLDRETLPNHYG